MDAPPASSRRSRPYPAVLDPLLPALVEDWRELFGDDLVGVYLAGSAIAGGFDPVSSDLDLVVVTGAEASEIDLAGLDHVHRRFAEHHPDWADRMDFVYVGRRTLDEFDTEAGTVATISHGDPLQVLPQRGWILTWYGLQQANAVLLGRAVEEVLGQVARADFLHELRRHVIELGERREPSDGAVSTAYRLLTLARALSTFAGGRDSTKEQGAEYARTRYPGYGPAIDEALRVRRLRGRTDFAEQLRADATELIDRLTEDARVAAVEDAPLSRAGD